MIDGQFLLTYRAFLPINRQFLRLTGGFCQIIIRRCAMAKSRTHIAVPPGAEIREQLYNLGMSQKEFAVRMSMSEKHISKLINGDVQLTPDVAMRLEMVLNVPASYWNSLEARYREKIVKAEAEAAMDADARLAERFPYDEMARLGWVPEAASTVEKVVNLRKYFGVVELGLLENEQIMRIACVRQAHTVMSDNALRAWAQEARILARGTETASLNPAGLAAAVPEIRAIDDFHSEDLKKLLGKNGVALVFVPEFEHPYAYGALFLDGSRAVLGLSENASDLELRHSLNHALAHIVLGHVGRPGLTEADEAAADSWADRETADLKAARPQKEKGALS